MGVFFCFGAYPADAFFTKGQYEKFDIIPAMYQNQGLIPFICTAIGEDVKYTTGLRGVGTSPDHGVAFNTAAQGKADESSFRETIYKCNEIINGRKVFEWQYNNRLKK
jgi:4-hydroxythreonine-4-phosphate dehydrogenase